MTTALTTLTYDDHRFIQAMRDVVAERGPDFVYPNEWRRDELDGCRYVYDGRPACIIGAALARMGVPLDVLSDHEGREASFVMRRAGLDVSDLVRDAAVVTQSAQDTGVDWGRVLNRFLVYIEHGATS
jgi:hypothetical protein